MAEKLNEIKVEIDAMKNEIDKRKEERDSLGIKIILIIELKGLSAQEIIIDEEEYKMIQTIKSLRLEYQKYYDELKNVRSEIDYCSHLVDQCRQKFMTEFEQWYDSIYGGSNANTLAIMNPLAEVCS